MKLRIKFILVITLLHLLALVLSFYVFKKNPELFILAEVVLLITTFISWQLYKQMLQPLDTLVQGIEAIKSKDFTINFLSTGTPEMDRLIEVFNAMMDQLKKERTTQQQQHFFLDKLIQTSPTGILILDFDEHIHQANIQACALLQTTEQALLKRQIIEIEHPLMREIVGLSSGSAKMISLDGVHMYKLQRSDFIDRGFRRSFVMIEELTAEILAAEKKAYGKVIRMMAHEVNNTVGPVNSIIESALKTTTLWSPMHETLRQALEVAYQRNQNMNSFMRDFADVVRLPLPRKAPVDLTQILGQVCALMQVKTGDRQIQLLHQLTEQALELRADRQQLEQALINILQNAIESIQNSGTIELVLDPVSRRLEIIDSGPGISDEHAESLFSPFFSTKPNGKGIGLTLVKEILLNHGFTFSLKTLAPQRTVFCIDFGFEPLG
ncbi:MAG: HAMP domain-containing protein [Sphingobacteriales bacterium]|nr:MAG: HAMP domain-containing protein [Sphingobacteriales bacterium]